MQSKAPITLLHFHKKKKQNVFLLPCIHISLLWIRSFSKILLKMDKLESGSFWQRSAMRAQAKTETPERFTFLCIGWLAATNKRLYFDKWLAIPYYWSNVNAHRSQSAFIWKRSNVSGQRFHQQKRVEAKREQFRRSLNVIFVLLFYISMKDYISSCKPGRLSNNLPVANIAQFRHLILQSLENWLSVKPSNKLCHPVKTFFSYIET